MNTGTAMREHRATLLVASMSSFFAATLILGVDVMVSAVDPALLESSGTIKATLMSVALIFVIIALYVGSIVTANTFSTIIAGRTRTIALYRLIGATSKKVRGRVAREGLVMGLIGGVIGFGFAELVIVALVMFGPELGWLPQRDTYEVFSPLALAAVAVVALTTWVAAWVGSRKVGNVSPIEATGASVEQSAEALATRSARSVCAIILMAVGAALLAIGVVMGLVSTLAILVSFVGGLLSFTGVALGAHLIMPKLLDVAGKLLGSGPTGRLAAANATRFPERSARATIGLVIGVTLVTMFAVTLATFETMTVSAFRQSADLQAELSDALALTSGVLTALVGFSAVIAAVGMVNTLSLSVMQRTRELGLLRALGFTGKQVRQMVLLESVQMTFVALLFGLLLGTLYGWVAAQSLMGSQVGLMAPTLPWLLLLGVAVFGAALALIASQAPAKRAVKVSPVAALSVG